MSHDIIVEWEVEEVAQFQPLLEQAITVALFQQTVQHPCEVNVLFTNDHGIQEINLEMRGIDRPTDVLSFPMWELTAGERPEAAWADPETGTIPLGDMVISVERAIAQGVEFGHGTKRELTYLAVHSVLHLLGYDHMDDGVEKEQMRAQEELIMTELGITREERGTI